MPSGPSTGKKTTPNNAKHLCETLTQVFFVYRETTQLWSNWLLYSSA